MQQSTACKQENLQSQCYNSVLIQRPESQDPQCLRASFFQRDFSSTESHAREYDREGIQSALCGLLLLIAQLGRAAPSAGKH